MPPTSSRRKSKRFRAAKAISSPTAPWTRAASKSPTPRRKRAEKKTPVDQETKDPRVYAPLATFAGKEPPAPAWFRQAIEQKAERGFVEVKGAKIETLAWGERG